MFRVGGFPPPGPPLGGGPTSPWRWAGAWPKFSQRNRKSVTVRGDNRCAGLGAVPTLLAGEGKGGGMKQRNLRQGPPAPAHPLRRNRTGAARKPGTGFMPINVMMPVAVAELDYEV